MTSRSGARSLVVVAIAVAVVAVAVIIATVALPTGERSHTVPVVGDSITFLAAHDISTALKAGGYRPNIKGQIGQRIDQMLQVLGDELRSDPFAVVENLGTNDALQAAKHPNWQSGFERMVAMLAREPCVELTTISTVLGGAAGRRAVASQINRAIAAAVSEHPNFHVVDWNAALRGPNGAKLLNSDHVHPSPAGQLALAVLTRTALDRDCRNS